MAAALVAVVLDALAGPRDEELRARLGPEIDDHLRAVLRARAVQWAREAAGEGAHEARTAAELPGLLGDHDGPVLLAAPDVPGLAAHHVRAALDDLAAGVTFSFAPSSDGSPFLIALARPDADILERVGEPFETLASTAAAAGGTFGMLRNERRLSTLADARALRADPVAPPEVRDLLPTSL